jgi:hypothetical protein
MALVYYLSTHVSWQSRRPQTKEVGRQVARFTFLHSSEQAREFLRLWETAPENPGGGS